jgi:DNA-binding Xre family transcriptional regulator
MICVMTRRLTTTIQDAVRSSGRTQKELADEAGIDKGQLSRFMVNTRTLTLPAVEKLCKVLGLELQPQRKQKRKGK